MQEFVQLLSVGLSVTSRRRSTDLTTSIANFSVLHTEVLQCVAQAGLNEGPGTLVLVLLLAPSNLSVRILLELIDKREEWEGRQLLESQDSDVVLAELLALLNQVVVDLARAEDDFTHFVCFDRLICLTHHSNEAFALSKIFSVGGNLSHLKHLFGCNNDQRLTEWSQELSAEHMEVLCCSSCVNDLHIALFVNITLWLDFGAIGRIT